MNNTTIYSDDDYVHNLTHYDGRLLNVTGSI